MRDQTDRAERIALDIDGVQWLGWEEVTITRAVDAVAGSFELSLADRWVEGMTALPLAPGMRCSIRAGSDELIRGHIDAVKPSLAATQHAIRVSGRDASADLVDCAALHTPGEWRQITCSRLATALAAPFGVRVRCEGAEGAPLAVHKIEPGETAWECLERGLRQRELMAMPGAGGEIVLVAIGAGRATTALVQGQNVLSAEVEFDARDRFSEYRVLAQQRGSDTVDAAGAASVVATASDPVIGRYRPHVISGETPKDGATARRRAEWEASVRAGRSVSVNVTVQGWRQGDGSLWPLNAMCRVVLPWLRIEQDLMIGKVVHRLSSGGTTTALTLRSPLAFAQEFEKKLKKDKDGKSADLLQGARELSEAEKTRILNGE